MSVSTSRYNPGDTVIVIDENRDRQEIGEYRIISVGRNYFYIRDSYGKAGFSLEDGFENAKDMWRTRRAFTPQDWELETKYRKLAEDFDDLGVTFRNIRKHSTRKLQAILEALKPIDD